MKLRADLKNWRVKMPRKKLEDLDASPAVESKPAVESSPSIEVDPVTGKKVYKGPKLRSRKVINGVEHDHSMPQGNEDDDE